jgi:hypothetical protein
MRTLQAQHQMEKFFSFSAERRLFILVFEKMRIRAKIEMLKQ